MKRGRREKIEKGNNIKYLVYLSGITALVMILTFFITFVIYNKKIKESSYSVLTTEKIAELVPNETNKDLEEASADIGKSIEEVIKKIEEDNKDSENKTAEKQIEQESKEEIKKENESITTNVEIVKIKDPEFSVPVDGEIVRKFAKDSLIYSETLEEWIIHLGIDIKSERATVVKASEAGTVTTIKNDPRYGLTVVIEHVNGYKTIYSNLLTTEFVEEGETVEKGQTIGTVGNSAAFEIVDEPHLHFEIIKDGENVDPNIYLK